MASEKPKVDVGQLYRTKGSSDTYRIKYVDLTERKVQIARLAYSMSKIWLNNLVTSLQIDHGRDGAELGHEILNLCSNKLSDGWNIREESPLTMSWDNFVESGFYEVQSIEIPVSSLGIPKA